MARLHNASVWVVALLALCGAQSFAAEHEGALFSTRSGTQFYAGGKVDITEQSESVFVAGGDINTESLNFGKITAAGGHISIRDVRANRIIVAGGHVAIDGVINKSVVAAAGEVNIAEGTKIGGDAILSGGNITLNADVGGDAILSGGKIEISGIFRGDVRLRGGDIAIAPGTRIAGDLNYRGREELKLPPDVIVGGSINREGAGVSSLRYWEHLGVAALGIAALAMSMFAATVFVLTLIALLVFAPLIDRAGRKIDAAPAKSFGVGFLMLLAMPTICMMLFFTLIGIPLALLCFALFPLICALGLVTALHWIGMRLRGLARRPATDVTRVHRVLWTFVGLIAFFVVGAIPIVGHLAQLIVMTMGIGALGLAIGSGRERLPPPPQMAAA